MNKFGWTFFNLYKVHASIKLSMACIVISFFYFTQKLEIDIQDIEKAGVEMVQRTEGKRPNLAQTKEGREWGWVGWGFILLLIAITINEMNS